MKNQAAEALTFLGFSEIESLIYCFLLKESPATGYRVSHGIGKPTANTYKAIAALAARGAIVIDDSASRSCRAVPYEELLDRLERDFAARRHSAEEELVKIKSAPDDDRVYYLYSIEQVLERARSMLASAKVVVLLDLFPRCAELLAPELERCAKRGVKTAARIYVPIHIKGVHTAMANAPERIMSTWPGQQLSVAADADQFLTALLSHDAARVQQALWSTSKLMSCLQYNAMHNEIVLSGSEALTQKTLSPLERWSLTQLRPPGFLLLSERYRDEAAVVEQRPKRARAKRS